MKKHLKKKMDVLIKWCNEHNVKAEDLSRWTGYTKKQLHAFMSCELRPEKEFWYKMIQITGIPFQTEDYVELPTHIKPQLWMTRNTLISLRDFKLIGGKQELIDLIKKEHGIDVTVKFIFKEEGTKDEIGNILKVKPEDVTIVIEEVRNKKKM